MTCSHQVARRTRPRRFPRAAAALATAAIALTAALAHSPANSAFTATTTSRANSAGSATLAPVTGLTATTRCTTGATPTFVDTHRFPSANSTAVQVTVPGTTQAGDLIVVHIGRSATTTPTPPTGFTLVHTDTSTGIGSWVFQRIATATDPNKTYTFTASGTVGSGMVSVYQDAAGLILASETSGQATGTATTTATMPSVTAGAPNSLLVFLVVALTGSSYNTIPTGMTQRYQVVSNNASFYAFTEARTASGATGTRSSTTGTAAPTATVGLLIRPATPTTSVDLTWTASASTYASGYQVRRDATTLTPLTGRTTTAWTDTGAGNGAHTWTLITTSGAWRSAPAQVSATVSC